VTPSKELAEIVGDDKLPRSEVVKKVWDDIK
jgi:chromatin remodeling complex protein RSC6